MGYYSQIWIETLNVQTSDSVPFLTQHLHFSAGLGEFKIRDMNDEINKLLREKGHWEVRIKELGGPDYRVSSYSIDISANVIVLFIFSVN